MDLIIIIQLTELISISYIIWCSTVYCTIYLMLIFKSMVSNSQHIHDPHQHIPTMMALFDIAHALNLKEEKIYYIYSQKIWGKKCCFPLEFILVWYFLDVKVVVCAPGVISVGRTIVLVWYWYCMLYDLGWYDNGWYDLGWSDFSWIWKWLVVCAPWVIFLPQWLLCQRLLLKRSLYAFKCCLIRNCL